MTPNSLIHHVHYNYRHIVPLKFLLINHFDSKADASHKWIKKCYVIVNSEACYKECTEMSVSTL